MLFAETENQIPKPFLAILVFWLFIIFLSFSLFSGSQCNSFSFSKRLWLIGVLCNLFDFRTERTVQWPDEDFGHSAAECTCTTVSAFPSVKRMSVYDPKDLPRGNQAAVSKRPPMKLRLKFDTGNP